MRSTKRYKLRASAVVLLALLVFSVAAVGVRAYEPCQRIVQKYVDRVVKHHYSKPTLEAWAIWAKEHPNWHPPKRHPLAPKETLDRVNFDCNVPEENEQIGALLDPEPLADDLPLIPTLVAINTAPPIVPRPVALTDVPVGTPIVTAVDTPEPSSWVFAATGVLLLVICVRRRGVVNGRNLLPAVSAL